MEITKEQPGYEGSLSDLVMTVRNTLALRWKLMVAITALIFIAGTAVVMMMTPRYVAVARVQIDPSRDPLANKSATQQSASLSPEAIDTEVSIVNSLDIAQQVVDKLHLQNDPELQKGLEGKVTAAPSSPEFKVALARALQKQVSASREKMTYIITIAVKSVDPVKAAEIANAYADLYIQSKVNSQAGSARSQVDWFRSRLDKLEGEVRAADARVAQYRAAAGIVTGGDNKATSVGTITDEQVGPLSSQLATAEASVASAHARLSAAQRQAASGGLESVSEVRSSPVVAELRRQRAELLRNIGDIQARYGDKHPESLRIRGQLDTLDRQIREEGERVLGSLRADAAAADAQVSSLQGSMNRLESKRAQGMRASVEADSLEREAEAKRDEYDRLSQMMLERTQAAQNSLAQAEVVGRATPPEYPAQPNKPLLMGLSLLLGLVAGAGTITIQEMMSVGVRSGNDVMEELGVPLLGAVPKLAKNENPTEIFLRQPTSIFSESFRVARASIIGLKSEPPLRTIAISSSLPSEGKTTTALAIARTFAIGGEKTIIVECDVRRAMLSVALGIEHGKIPGLVQYLHGDVSLDDIIQPGSVANLDRILVREPYFSSEDLFSGSRIKVMLDELKKRYDRIILDLPPLIGLADGRLLASMADGMALIIKWDETPLKAVQSCMQSLQTDGTKVIGAILTMVDTRAEAIGSLYYSKKYSSYYQKS